MTVLPWWRGTEQYHLLNTVLCGTIPVKEKAATPMSTPHQEGDSEATLRDRILEAASRRSWKMATRRPARSKSPRARGSKRELSAQVGNQQEMLVACITVAEAVHAPEVARALESVGREARRAALRGILGPG
jgi:hypothetical protein